jgi:hypothetical protein
VTKYTVRSNELVFDQPALNGTTSRKANRIWMPDPAMRSSLSSSIVLRSSCSSGVSSRSSSGACAIVGTRPLDREAPVNGDGGARQARGLGAGEPHEQGRDLGGLEQALHRLLGGERLGVGQVVQAG